MSGNMLKEDRVAFIDQRLQELYPNPPVPLDHTDPLHPAGRSAIECAVYRRASQSGDAGTF